MIRNSFPMWRNAVLTVLVALTSSQVYAGGRPGGFRAPSRPMGNPSQQIRRPVQHVAQRATSMPRQAVRQMPVQAQHNVGQAQNTIRTMRQPINSVRHPVNSVARQTHSTLPVLNKSQVHPSSVLSKLPTAKINLARTLPRTPLPSRKPIPTFPRLPKNLPTAQSSVQLGKYEWKNPSNRGIASGLPKIPSKGTNVIAKKTPTSKGPTVGNTLPTKTTPKPNTTTPTNTNTTVADTTNMKTKAAGAAGLLAAGMLVDHVAQAFASGGSADGGGDSSGQAACSGGSSGGSSGGGSVDSDESATGTVTTACSTSSPTAETAVDETTVTAVADTKPVTSDTTTTTDAQSTAAATEHTFKIHNVTEAPLTYSIRVGESEWGTYTIEVGKDHEYSVAQEEMELRYTNAHGVQTLTIPGEHIFAFADLDGTVQLCNADPEVTQTAAK